MANNAAIVKTSYPYGPPFTTAIGVHHDGDPAATGWLLHHYYQNEADIDRLLENDSISRLGISPEARPHLHTGIPHGLDTIAAAGPNPIPRYLQPGDTDDMIKSEWYRNLHPRWVYLRAGGPWLVWTPGTVFRPLYELVAEVDIPIVWPFENPDGSTAHRDKEWLLSNLPPQHTTDRA